jgi:hypothetical protein
MRLSRLSYILIGSAVLATVLCMGGYWVFELAFQLVAGWVFFLWRVSPDVRMTWDGVLTSLVSVAGLAAGLHYLLGWAHRQRRVNESACEADLSWPLRWTLMLVGLAVLMFVAGMSAVGASYQTARFLKSSEPLSHSWNRQSALRAMSTNNLRQIALACHNYHDKEHTLPAGGTFDKEGRALHGWMTELLPYMGNEQLYSRIDRTRPWTDPSNAAAFQTVVAPYVLRHLDPMKDTDGYAVAHYAANTRVMGGDVARALKHITDGPSHTILLGEAAGNFKPWGCPMNWRDPAMGINRSPDGFGSLTRQKGTVFCFADGSAHFLSENITPQVLKALSTPAGGEFVPDDLLESQEKE